MNAHHRLVHGQRKRLSGQANPTQRVRESPHRWTASSNYIIVARAIGGSDTPAGPRGEKEYREPRTTPAAGDASG